MTDAVVGDTVTEKSDPAPAKLTSCGLPTALSVIVSKPVLLPDAVGVNVTLMVQFAPGATLAPQELSWAKSPVTVILLMSSGAEPLLVMVMVIAALVTPRGWLGNVRLVGDRVTSGAAEPTPERAMLCGLLAALSVMVIEPYRLPGAVGVKVTVMVQLIPPTRLVGQLLV